jgi:hypothetical protein
MNMIFDNTPSENYFNTHVLADFSQCATTGINKFSGAIIGETVAVISSNQVYPCIFYLSKSMDNITPINQFAAPMGAQLETLESLKPILTPGWLRLSLINLIQER